MTSATPLAPADVLARRTRVTLAGDADGLADLHAADATIEWPFATTAGQPARLQGREAIREYARTLMTSPLRLDTYEVTELHQTLDPEVVVAEVRATATLMAAGRSITTTSVQILRISDGQIVSFRDFADPRALEAAHDDA